MTDLTADAAKLLPCPTFWVVERFENERSAGYWSGGNSRSFLPDIEKAIHFCRREDAMWTIMGWHWDDIKITEHSYIENTRPQPAPPEGEPDGWRLVPVEPTSEMVDAAILTFVRENGGIEQAPAITYRAMVNCAPRLGAASRPKVEDAK